MDLNLIGQEAGDEELISVSSIQKCLPSHVHKPKPDEGVISVKRRK
jgi:hypothetical protein